jgi:hypothetical protein
LPRPHKRRSHRSTGSSAPAARGPSGAQDSDDAELAETATDDHEAERSADTPARNGDGDGATGNHASDDEAPADHGEGATDVPAPDRRPTRSFGPMESIARRPLLALLPVLVLVTLAGLIGVTRAPVYSAEARLLVGSLVRDFTPASGLVAANQELTDIYSRVVGSPEHLDLTARELGEDLPADSVDASPVPETPFIRVEATGDTQEEAIRRADAAAAALSAFGADLRAQAVARDQALVDDINAKSEALAAARLERDNWQETYNTLSGATAPNAATLEAARVGLVAAEATVATAQLEVNALRAQLDDSDTATRGGIELNEFSAAEPMGSDRRSTFVLYVAVAVILGALIGAALATLSANHWRLLPVEGPDGEALDGHPAAPASAFIWSHSDQAFVPVRVGGAERVNGTAGDGDDDRAVTTDAADSDAGLNSSRT